MVYCLLALNGRRSAADELLIYSGRAASATPRAESRRHSALPSSSRTCVRAGPRNRNRHRRLYKLHRACADDADDDDYRKTAKLICGLAAHA
jgi:hypothetical protein